MRIQDTNEIMNEARIKRLDAERHSSGLDGGSLWQRMKSTVPSMMHRRSVQVGLSTLVTAVAGMMIASRSRRNHGFNFGR